MCVAAEACGGREAQPSPDSVGEGNKPHDYGLEGAQWIGQALREVLELVLEANCSKLINANSMTRSLD